MHVFGVLIIFFCFQSYASTLISNIHDVEYSRDGKEPTLVFLDSGRVLKLRPHLNEMIKKLNFQMSRNNSFEFLIDKNRFIKTISPSKIRSPRIDLKRSLNILDDDYIPTTIENMKIAKSYFGELPYNPKESQCFNRAMVWTYELWKHHSLKSNKILIFFTRNYIRRYNFEWWFHIAPYVHIMENETVVERVMDRKYTSGPLAFKRWTDIFMRNHAVCPVITKYSEYADYPYSGDCMIIRTHMYTYQPADLQMYEAWSYEKSAFNMQEVKAAYLEAFDINL